MTTDLTQLANLGEFIGGVEMLVTSQPGRKSSRKRRDKWNDADHNISRSTSDPRLSFPTILAPPQETSEATAVARTFRISPQSATRRR